MSVGPVDAVGRCPAEPNALQVVAPTVEPAEIVVCDTTSDGEQRVARERRVVAGADRVLAALRRPDAVTEDGGCGGAAPLAPAVFFLMPTAGGTEADLVRPRVPAGHCGLARPEVDDALAAAAYAVVASRTIDG